MSHWMNMQVSNLFNYFYYLQMNNLKQLMLLLESMEGASRTSTLDACQIKAKCNNNKEKQDN